MKTLSMLLLLVGAAGLASAAVPEIDPGSGASALALIAGAILAIRSRRKN